MKPSLPNLFESLFDFHPREDHTPKENFLTESFAYLLRTDEGVRNGWLSVRVTDLIHYLTVNK